MGVNSIVLQQRGLLSVTYVKKSFVYTARVSYLLEDIFNSVHIFLKENWTRSREDVNNLNNLENVWSN